MDDRRNNTLSRGTRYQAADKINCIIESLYDMSVRSVYKELHADHETGAADNK